MHKNYKNLNRAWRYDRQKLTDIELYGLAIWQELLLIPGLSACKQTNLPTIGNLSVACADHSLLLPARCITAETLIQPTANHLKCAQAPVFVRITYSLSL